MTMVSKNRIWTIPTRNPVVCIPMEVGWAEWVGSTRRYYSKCSCSSREAWGAEAEEVEEALAVAACPVVSISAKVEYFVSDVLHDI